MVSRLVPLSNVGVFSMSLDIRTRAAATFSALILASLLTTSAAIAATAAHGGMSARQHGVCPPSGCAGGALPLQAKPAHVAKVNAAIAIRGASHGGGGRRY